jgi:hypothetical protein
VTENGLKKISKGKYEHLSQEILPLKALAHKQSNDLATLLWEYNGQFWLRQTPL